MPPEGAATVSLRALLEDGLQGLQLKADDQQIGKLLDYVQLLQRWNKAFNLTAVRQPEQMIGLHVLDSLSLHPFLAGERLIDIGSGAGLPGIPLAILNPHRQFDLLDSNGKKTRFLCQARQTLSLNNVTEIQDRVEDFQPRRLYDVALSRAFGDLSMLLQVADHLLATGGFFLAMKGKYPHTELSAIPKGYIVAFSRPLRIPGVDGDRHLVRIDKSPVHHC